MARSFEFVVCLLMVGGHGVKGSGNVMQYSVGEEFESMVEDMVNGEGDFSDFDSPSSFSNQFFHGEEPGEATQLNGFSWSNCGNPKTDPQALQSLSLSPNPLRTPGNIMVSFDTKVTQSMAAPIKVEVTLEKKILIWIKVPCTHNVGSCTYKDVCSMITSCPAEFKKQGIPCNCPVAPGQYKLTEGGFNIPKKIPKGEYRMTAKMSRNGQAVGCYKLNLSFS